MPLLSVPVGTVRIVQLAELVRSSQRFSCLEPQRDGRREGFPCAMTDADAPGADSANHPAALSPSTYDPPPASSADLAHAERLLAHQGMIPLADAAGHRAAVHLWREHCQREKARPLVALQAAVDMVLAAPGPTLSAHGKSLPAEYRWIRPAELIVTTQPNFPYHTTAAGLAELAGRLIAEQLTRGDCT